MRLIPIAALLVCVGAPAEANGWGTASDVGRDALVVAALGAPLAGGDWTGLLQSGESLAATGGVTSLLKQTIHETRPDRSDRQSFPSGHTSISFASAATIENRYGWHAGAPAFAVAAFVGVARVEVRRHFWQDAVAGAAIGTASGLLLTSRHDESVRLLPWGDAHGGGVTVAARF